MFACLLVAKYDTYNIAYMYLSTSLLRNQELPAKCDILNTVLVLDGNILCTIQNYLFVSNCIYFIENRMKVCVPYETTYHLLNYQPL